MRIVFDLDSCLTDTRHRRSLCPTVNPDSTWGAYYDACAEDAAMSGPVALARLFANAGAWVHLLTWRPVRLDVVTNAWLRRQRVPYHVMRMRTTEDEAQFGQDSTAYKVAYLRWLIGCDRRPDLVVEDWPEVVLAVEALGVPVLCVNPLYRERSAAEAVGVS